MRPSDVAVVHDLDRKIVPAVTAPRPSMYLIVELLFGVRGVQRVESGVLDKAIGEQLGPAVDA